MTTRELSIAWESCITVLLCTAYIMAPEFSYAATPTISVVGNSLCIGATWYQTNAARGIAIMGVVILGIGALLGKVTWTTATIVGVGVATLFGAPFLVRMLGQHVGSSVTKIGNTNCS